MGENSGNTSCRNIEFKADAVVTSLTIPVIVPCGIIDYWDYTES